MCVTRSVGNGVVAGTGSKDKRAYYSAAHLPFSPYAQQNNGTHCSSKVQTHKASVQSENAVAFKRHTHSHSHRLRHPHCSEIKWKMEEQRQKAPTDSIQHHQTVYPSAFECVSHAATIRISEKFQMNKIEMNRTTTSIVARLSSDLSVRTHRTFQFLFFCGFFFNWNSQTVFLALVICFVGFFGSYDEFENFVTEWRRNTKLPTHKSILRFLRRFFCCCCCRCCLFLSLQLFARLPWRFCSLFLVVVMLCLRLLGLAKEIPSPLPSIRREWTEREYWTWTWWRRMSTEEKEMCVWHWTVIGFW